MPGILNGLAKFGSNRTDMKFPALTKYFVLGATFIVLIIAPLFLTPYYSSLVTSVLLWIGLTISWHFFCGTTKYVSLGSAAFFGIGAYVTAIFSGILPFPLVLILAGVINFIFACGVGLVTLRLKGIYFAIFTFGLSELLNNAILFWEMEVTGTRGRFIASIDVYYPTLIITFIIILSTILLMRSKLIFALKMIGECEEAANHSGVNTTFYKIIGFAISGMFIGLLGAAFASKWGYIDSGMAFNSLYSFMPAIMTLFGGIETFLGPVVGAVALSLLEEYLLTSFKDYFMIILGSIMIIVIIILPEGITGKLLRG